MEKRLRSVIHERFPFDLRVEIELLSKRRDLINEEKHDELIKLLRKYNMEDIVRLGPGTNRYAFKLDGFVIKVATDNDGKIDNLKEFKMAKRLYPYVTKTYEVSENGTLLVAEYIQPFESYREMCIYSEKIKAILEKLSAVYLIGDVGITSKNFSNWGLRIGTEEPVCLDFAYVYEVKSELFVCRYCKTNSILVPTSDFTKLQCSNPACGKIYLFEDIRAKIGNDLHRHEIGDLTEEGYALTESGVLTELTEERSNYLKKKEVKKESTKKVEVKEEFVPDNFVMDRPPKYYIEHEEETTMNERIKSVADQINKNNPDGVPVFRARVLTPEEVQELSNNHENEAPILTAKVIQMSRPEETIPPEDEDMGIVFEGDIGGDAQTGSPEIEGSFVGEDEDEEQESDAEEESENQTDLSLDFCKNIRYAVSTLSNFAKASFVQNPFFDDIRSSIKERKVWPADFYADVQNVIYHSLMLFLGFLPDESGKRYVAPMRGVSSIEATPTALFVQNYWKNKSINEIEIYADMKEAYETIYHKPFGFYPEWVPYFEKQLQRKFKNRVDPIGIQLTKEAVLKLWLASDNESHEETIPPEDNSSVTFEPEETVEPSEPESQDEGEEEDPFAGDFEMNVQETQVVQNPSDDESDDLDDEEEVDEDEEDSPDYLTINIIHEENMDIVRISCDDPYGYTAIPLYCKLDEVGKISPPSLSDDRNGMWDWLIHISPDFMFRTKDPNRWLKLANDGERYQGQIHMYILEEEENGTYLMGATILDGIYEYTEDCDEPVMNLNDEMIQKINNLICNEIGLSHISHYARSISMKANAKDESYIQTVFKIQEMDDLDDEEEGDGEMNLSEVEKAALRVAMGTDDQNPDDIPVTNNLKEAAAKMANELVTAGTEEKPVAEPDPEPVVETPEEEKVLEVVPPQPKVEEKKPEEKPAEENSGVLKPVRRIYQ